ncbi:amidase [Paraburkholderia rhizosphaerae]|uniref:Asp-tRNA(Asn)/Glu-tRNA(Gln) amidotransferase A subunit family amidase n=1 Tax=Paraburkholderia rhizosphaerae TaxID=480658 RepID=A0A4R8LUW6_9BURK|nr:amidase family protein [Paraburkholderia rhizosphaerae]TDY51494.1 Asp-tRNA(Asn)/Glu-tRNA(Gln) amidotransferase A subunit family amidase [Paraburkholderia rhizosphaerae]
MDESVVALSAVDARRMIGSRELSPVELLDACIARIEALNPAVNAIAATDFERARDAARRAEQAVLRGEPLGPLHGLPVGIKDLEETAGLLTTYGSPIYRAHVPQHDHVLVARLRAAGAIVAAKTNVPEFGAGANTRNAVWGATGNPFNPLLNAGGSSGGSATALATDMLPICTGSDTGGSLRIPAALCGVVGLRPSPGLVPNDQRTLGWTPISVVGPMGRDVADTRLQLAATVGLEASDPISIAGDAAAFAHFKPVDLATLRVAYTEDFGVSAVDDNLRKTFRAKIDALARDVKVCEPLDLDMGEADRCFDIIRAQNFVASFKEIYERDPALLGANTRTNYEMGSAMSLADVVWAHTEQTNLFRRFQKVFERYDVIVSPTTPITPFPWSQPYLAEINGKPLANYYRWLALTYLVTLATNPAISLPCGVDHAGMPFGMQVVGAHRADARLLDISQSLEAHWQRDAALRRPRPDLAKLAHPVPELKSIVTAPAVI